MSIIEFREVNKFFGNFQVLEDINFSGDEGEVVVVIGPSGSGKSTLLRCINGLEEISSGELVVDGMRVGETRQTSTPCGPRSGWSSSSSTSTRTRPPQTT